MANIEKIKLGGTSYDVRDASAAHSLSDVAIAGDGIDFENNYVTKNYENYGVTVVDGVASGFNQTNLLYVNDLWASKIATATTSFDIIYKIKWTSGTGCLAYNLNSSGLTYVFQFWIYSTGKIEAIMRPTSSGTAIASSADPAVTAGIDTWVKVSYVSGQPMTISVSTNGTDYTKVAQTPSNVSSIYDGAGSKFVIGRAEATNTFPFNGTINLKECKVIVDGETVWVGGVQTTKTGVSIESNVLRNLSTGSNAVDVNILGTSNNSVTMGAGATSAASAVTFGASARGNPYGISIGRAAGSSGATGNNAISIGNNANPSGGSQAGTNSIAIGNFSSCSGNNSIAIGVGPGNANCATTADNAIQLGYGINSTAKTFNVGFYDDSTPVNYTLLDGATGVIPIARLGATAGDTDKFLKGNGTWAEAGGGSTSLSDIAVAGDNILFTQPSIVDYVSSSDKKNGASIETSGLFTPTSSQYIQFTSSSIPNYGGSIFTGNYDWSWTFKFKSPADVTQMHVIFKAGLSLTNFNIWCAISEGNSTQKHIALGVHLSNNTWSNDFSGDGITEIQPETWYWCRLSRDYTNGVYKLELSTDGSSWITDISFNSTYALYNANSTFFLANTYSSSGDGTAEYDMTGCKFTTSYSSVSDYVAYIYDDRTKISASVPSVDQTYNSSSANAQSGVAISGAGFLNNTATGTNSLTIAGNVASVQRSTNIGISSTVGGNNCCVAVGYNAIASNASDGCALALGTNANASGSHSVAIGSGKNASGIAQDNALSSGFSSIAIGNYPRATADSSIAIGYKTYAGDTKIVAIGSEAGGSGPYSVAIGANASAGNAYGHMNSIAIGSSSQSRGSHGIAIGDTAKANADYTIQLGYGTNNTANTMNVGLSNNLNVQLLDSAGHIPGGRMSLSGASAPDTSTVGSVGQFYVDTTNQDAYICVGDASSTYTWKKITP